MIFSAREKIRLGYYKFMSTSFNKVCHSQELDVNNDDKVLTTCSSNHSEDCSDLPSFEEQLYNQQEAEEDLNSVFRLLKIKTIRDKSIYPSK